MQRSGRRPRALVVAALGLALAGLPHAEPPADESRESLLQRAETDLGRVDAAVAVEAFERVAAMGHDADGELGLVRAYMQAGQYRRALAFCAHVAGEHADVPGAAVLYAWLLRVGGQHDVAQAVLAELLKRAPSDPLAMMAAKAFASPWPAPAAGMLIERPHRVAPVGVEAPGRSAPPQEARVVSSGVLLGDGLHALIPALAGDPVPQGRFWVRNGLGQGSEAVIDSSAAFAAPQGVVILRLRASIAAAGTDDIATRAPFAGSPGFALEFADGSPATPAWPLLHAGFFGAQSSDARLRRLGIEVGAGPQGGPVFDASGRLAGLALRGDDGRAMLLPVSTWPTLASVASLAPSVARAPRPLPADEIYERALRIALQVIAAP